MSIDNFKKQLHEILDKQGFEGSTKVFRKVEGCPFEYNRGSLSTLRGDAIEPMAGLKPNEFLVRLRNFIDSIHESNVQNTRYNDKQKLDNQIFRKFIFLNREEHVADLKMFCYGVKDKSKEAEVYQVRSDNCHRADWLFHRLYLEIIKDENHDFEYHDSVLIRSNLNFGEFVNDVKRKYKQKRQQSGTANEHILAHLPPEKVHLVPFVIDAQKEDKHLDKFIVDFYDFWKNKTLNINCLILLAVNIRENKPSLLERFIKKHVPSIEPNISKLRHIRKGDIQSLFQYELECGHFIKRVKKEEASINDLWEHLCPLIHKALMQK